MTEDLEQINHAVAAIAGWTDIKEWEFSRKAKPIYQGRNLSQPESGIFVPSYASDLNAITKAFDLLGLDWNIGQDCEAYSLIGGECTDAHGETPAIALCKLLLAINPEPLKPVTKEDPQQIESTVVEAAFG
jgi:hypothetical protein